MRRKWVAWLVLLAGLAVLAGYGIMTYQSSLRAGLDASALPSAPGYQISEIHGHDYLKGGVRLLLGTPKSQPAQDQKTFLLVNDKLQEVKSLDDFAGQLELRGRADALDFVTHFAGFSHAHWRPLTRLESLLGQPTEFETSSRRLRVGGALTDDEARANDLGDPSAESEDNGFTVTEWVWSVDPSQGGFMEGSSPATTFVHQVAFHLTPDGHVREEVLHKKKLVGLEFVLVPENEGGKGK